MDPKDIKKEYTNGEITVVWESGKCIHSGNCARGNADVFKPREKPWVQPENSTSEKNHAYDRYLSVGRFELL